MIPGSANALLLATAAPTGYNISRSLRFNSADSAYLSRTPASAGNRKTWTWAGWVKRGSIGSSYEILFSARAGTSSNRDYLTFQSDQLVLTCSNSSGTTTANIQTTSVYRDPGAWMHIVLSVDTTQATASNRVKFYVNGTQITTFSLANYPTQNTDFSYNDAQPHTIGQSAAGTAFGFNGYLADIHFIDGQALDPTSFGEFSATTGVWMPKAYTGSYGTNGFRLTFADNSAATATTLGKDAAGSNNWTPNNLSVTAGAGNDSLVDVPTTSGIDNGNGGEIRGNYCVVNPLVNYGTYPSTISNGNLDVVGNASSSYGSSVVGTIGVSTGKWYFEATPSTAIAPSNGQVVGIVGSQYNPAADTDSYFSRYSFGYGYRKDGQKENNNSASSYGASYALGDVIGVAFDLDAGTITFYKNGVSQGQAYSGLSGTFYPSAYAFGSRGWTFNFGARPWAYAAPSGFKALCTSNLPTPLVTKPSTVMDVKLYTGNGSTQTISGLGFSPDLVWMKVRSIGYNHTLIDSVRGATKTLSSSMTVQEYTEPTGPTAFTSDGWSMSGDVTYVGSVNANGQTYAGWCWDAGSSTVTNTQGSITSSVRTNNYLSIVTWTGDGSGRETIGHGLGVAPSLIFVKDRSNSSGRQWNVYHRSLGATQALSLNTTGGAFTDIEFWNNTAPTASVFSVGAYENEAQNYVAYCFAPVAGYSSAFSFTGNGSSDGVFQWLGFRARMILIKRTDTTGDWYMWDAVRNTFNVVNLGLLANSSGSELTLVNAVLDVNSNGFKLRGADAGVNASGGTYVGFAWAEAPFQYARAR